MISQACATGAVVKPCLVGSGEFAGDPGILKRSVSLNGLSGSGDRRDAGFVFRVEVGNRYDASDSALAPTRG